MRIARLIEAFSEPVLLCGTFPCIWFKLTVKLYFSCYYSLILIEAEVNGSCRSVALL